MIRRRLGALLATLALGLAGGTVAAAPAQAASFSCGARYFLKAAAVDRYLSVEPSDGFVYADRTDRGWWEQFQVCRDSSWSSQFFVLKSEAMSSKEGGAAYMERIAGSVQVSRHTLTGNDLFQWSGDGNPYRGLVHAETGKYVTAERPQMITLGPANLGWYQALYRES
ncbi:hypothetical protein Asp14428_68520 [Actinoplanes sp. NBRC 14428]|uniref:Ricin-type beta-trefoil lectin protein n=1 Tax=Pseudosporangium ferrugineum TaxID=439699 RepID=A0A2T0RQD5_9ACTN|nr:hypothetical protein [Pseudosporangium ferrugineum]PRY23388.1 hypothetical protein CLV70_115121 [Pseudosporangium ferrugineum]BCJ55377.1 hypothetical protein Asp14428_68520 [Actinoplanes sp. NBRC 14428]